MTNAMSTMYAKASRKSVSLPEPSFFFLPKKPIQEPVGKKSIWHSSNEDVNCRFPGASQSAAGAAPAKADDGGDEDDFELFGSDDEETNAAAEKLKQERLAAYEAKKSKSAFSSLCDFK